MWLWLDSSFHSLGFWLDLVGFRFDLAGFGLILACFSEVSTAHAAGSGVLARLPWLWALGFWLGWLLASDFGWIRLDFGWPWLDFGRGLIPALFLVVLILI